MQRIETLLRASVLPLIGLAGVVLTAFGVAEWQRFYRRLYAEEHAALVALHKANEDVYYRRNGDVEDRWSVPDANEPIPSGAPFAGRVEAIWINRPRNGGQWGTKDYQSVPASVRDRALRLPGLTSYQELDANATFKPLNPEKILKRALPAFEPPLNMADLDADFPRGEPIAGTARAELLETIEQAWRSAEPPGDEPKLVVSDGYPFSVVLQDGERSWRYQRSPSDLRQPMSSQGVREQFELSDGETFRAIEAFGDERFVLELRPANEPFLPPPATRPHESPFHPGMIIDSSMDLSEGLLDLSALPVKTVERIDDQRVRIAFDQFEVAYSAWSHRLVDAEIILRSDMDWALERAAAHVDTYSIAWRKAYPDALPQAIEAYQELRRLVRAGDRVYSAERLRRNRRLNKDAQVPLSESSERYAVEFAPTYSETIFDPRAYPATPMPEPTRLPLVRRYRVLDAAGLLAIGVACGGMLTGLGRRRTRNDMAEIGAKSTSRSKSRRRSLLPGLRFGFATLGAAALLTISAAGWFRSKLDAVEEELAALESVSREGVEFDIERREPSFPWTWLASETWPLDSPVVAVRIVGDLPEEACAPVLRLPDLEEYRWSRLNPGFDEPPIEDPNFAKVYNFSGEESPVEEAFQAPLPSGELATPEESRRIAAQAFAAWAAARRAFPMRYVVRRHVGDLGPSQYPGAPPDPAVARDGDRVAVRWASNIFEMPQALSDDGRFLYWFACNSSKAPYPWRLRERHGRESAGQSRIERWLPPADERRPIPDFELYEESVVLRLMLDALHQEPPALNVASVERLPGTRWRIEFEPPRVAPYDGYGFHYIRNWFIVVDEALGWAIVERYIEAYGPDHGSDPFRDARFAGKPTPFGYGAVRCDYRTIDKVEMREGTPIVIQSRTCREGYGPGNGFKYPQTLVNTYDFDPQFQEATFRSPDLGAQPAPAVRIPPTYAWYQATALLACGIFGYGLLRRLVGRQHPADAATTQS